MKKIAASPTEGLVGYRETKGRMLVVCRLPYAGRLPVCRRLPVSLSAVRCQKTTQVQLELIT